MKNLILSLFILIGAAENLLAQTPKVLVEVRSGDWPVTLKKSGYFYFLQFRDQQVLTSVVLDTLPFKDTEQLKYMGKALSVLKTGNNGDIAKFKDYSIKRTDSKIEGISYLLRYQWGLTNFKQPEADTLISIIKKL